MTPSFPEPVSPPVRKRQPVAWAWALSVGLHIALFGGMACTGMVESPRAGTVEGAPSPALLILNASAEPDNSAQPDSVSAAQESPPLSAPGDEPHAPAETPDVQAPCALETADAANDAGEAKSAPEPHPASLGRAPHPVASVRPAARAGGHGVPLILQSPPPEYPLQERRAGHEGTVLLRICVDSKGVPSNVAIAASSGFPLLDSSAQRTVCRRWRFQAVADTAEYLIPIRFCLNDYRRRMAPF